MQTVKQKLTDVGHQDALGNYHCPKCGGIQFQPIRSMHRKVLFGVAALLADKNELRCLTCGTKFYSGASSAPPARPDL